MLTTPIAIITWTRPPGPSSATIPIAIRKPGIASMMSITRMISRVDGAAEVAGGAPSSEPDARARRTPRRRRSGASSARRRSSRESSSRPRSSTPSQCSRDGPGQQPFGEQSRGSARAGRTARAAARRSPTNDEAAPTITKPTIAPGLRRARCSASRQRPPPGGSSSSSRASSSATDISAPASLIRGLMQPVREVDEQVDDDEDDGDEQDAALEDGVVAVVDRGLQPRADAREREDRLGEDRAGEQQPDLQADDRRDRQHRVPQHVAPVDERGAQALRPRGADVVLVLDVEHGGARDPRDDRERDRAERDRRQDQVLDRVPGGLPVARDDRRRARRSSSGDRASMRTSCRPTLGSQPSLTAKMYLRISARKKIGIEIPISDSDQARVVEQPAVPLRGDESRAARR